jgi:hypothetical protein
MISKAWQRRAALFLLLVYCLDLAWKLAHWREFFSGIAWWGIALGFTVRFAFMGFILSLYLRLRNAPPEPTAVTRETKNTSVRFMRIVHIVLLLAIASYAFVAEWLIRPSADAPVWLVGSFCFMAALMVLAAFGFRRKLLPAALNALQHDPSDPAALGRWRAANLVSMILAVSVSLIGVALRVSGGSRRVVWPFFIVSALLMLWWRPRLDDSGSSSGITPLPLT